MKSHPTPQLQGRRGAAFTLIELLIVIVIIAILAAVAFPVTGLVMDQARKAEAKHEVRNIKNAISLYELDYGKLPFGGGGGGDLQLDTETDDIIALLSGENIDGLNAREKGFFEGKRAKGGDGNWRSGTYGSGVSLKLVDPWGSPYYVVLDADYDGIIEGLPGMGGDELRAKIAVYSKSKPKKEDTGSGAEYQDETKWIKSWE